jgi:Flp pilus assembly protein TadD
VRSLEQRDFKAAEGFFRKGVAITPASTMLGRSLRHKLATALYLEGDIRGAVDQFEQVVRSAPADGRDETAAKAHYSLGVLMATAGRGDEAIRHLTAAVAFNPNYLEASQALADAQRRAGRTAAALPIYENIIKLNPRAADARFGYGMGLVRLKRWSEAKAWLLEATRLQPDDPQLKHALARLLAAAPDDTVREGGRALAIVQELLPSDNTTALGETLAMAYAEVGNFADAIGVQRSIIDAANRAGLTFDARRMSATLRLYEKGQPCRTPWGESDAVFSPGPPIAHELAAILPRPSSRP